MKNAKVLSFAFVPITLIILFAGCQPGSDESADVQADVAAIEALLQHYGSVVTMGDLDAWAAMWVDDSVIMPPDMPAVYGKEDILALQAPAFENFKWSMTVNTEEVKVSGDLAFARGTYSAMLTPKGGGEPEKVEGKFLSILERQEGGTWKFARDCFNSSVPPEEPVEEVQE
jgi:uncharacterized protein (TIGR02246 family)